MNSFFNKILGGRILKQFGFATCGDKSRNEELLDARLSSADGLLGLETPGAVGLDTNSRLLFQSLPSLTINTHLKEELVVDSQLSRISLTLPPNPKAFPGSQLYEDAGDTVLERNNI